MNASTPRPQYRCAHCAAMTELGQGLEQERLSELAIYWRALLGVTKLFLGALQCRIWRAVIGR
jgi:hypothetical protein